MGHNTLNSEIIFRHSQMSYYKTYIINYIVYGIIFVHSFLIAGTTGKISGTVVDKETGEPLIGCNVMVDGTALGAASHIDGTYFILNIPPGTYSLRADMIGFGTVRKTEVPVEIDFTSQIDFQLSSVVIEGKRLLS